MDEITLGDRHREFPGDDEYQTNRARNANRLADTEMFSTKEQMPTEMTSPRATSRTGERPMLRKMTHGLSNARALRHLGLG
jgi:hypothetical protein